MSSPITHKALAYFECGSAVVVRLCNHPLSSSQPSPNLVWLRSIEGGPARLKNLRTVQDYGSLGLRAAVGVCYNYGHV